MLTILIALAAASTPPSAPPTEVWRSVQAMNVVARTAGDALWPGYGEAPFGLLIVTAGGETLACESRLPPGFVPGPREPLTGCSTASRPRSGLPTNLLAAMPVFGPPSTVVMGTPTATGYEPVEWRRAVLHEHFHQWQWALPGYYVRTAALGLSGGDATGMWMLEYPFPYGDVEAGAAYRSASAALLAALKLRGQPGFEAAYDHYLMQRAAFSATVDAKAWRYLEFQLWQEGAARSLRSRWAEPPATRRWAPKRIGWKRGCSIGWRRRISRRRAASSPIRTGQGRPC